MEFIDADIPTQPKRQPTRQYQTTPPRQYNICPQCNLVKPTNNECECE